MPLYRNIHRFGIILILLFLFALTSLTRAQDASPLQLGQNAIGELTAEINTLRYSLTTLGSETASVQVLALTPTFIPRFRVLSPSGVEILVAANPNALSSLTADASLPDAGTYIIEVSGDQGSLGQFVLSLQAGIPLPEAVELIIDQPASGTVGSSTSVQVYHFSTPSTDPPILTVLSESPDAGVLLSLFNENTAKTIATSDATFSGIAYHFSPHEASYRLEIRASDAPTNTPYTLCLGTCEGILLTSQAQQVAVSATPEAAATCAVASANGGTVNIRGGAGTQFVILGSLSASQPLPALGRLADGSWIQVSLPNGSQGWAAASVTRLEGDCATLPVVAAPANAALAPTQPPAPTNPPPTAASSGGTSPTAMPTPEPPPAVTLPDLSAAFANVTVDDSSVEVNFVVSLTGISLPDSLTYEICLDGSCYSFGYAPLVMGNNPIKVFMSPTLINPRRIVHQITVTVDSTGSIEESNESNNVATYNFQT